jgi:hypothetical protein
MSTLLIDANLPAAVQRALAEGKPITVGQYRSSLAKDVSKPYHCGFRVGNALGIEPASDGGLPPRGREVATETAELTVDGIRYAVEVDHDEDGRHHVKFTSDPPPIGMHRVRYEWTGRVPGAA